ncbi:MAG: hypothetical protein KC777_20830 [Cyanobacteria bacterium HKST-UBA02]|nr:hypothetical protein [Cyanobacteria bacterium HKST-UBA02]
MANNLHGLEIEGAGPNQGASTSDLFTRLFEKTGDGKIQDRHLVNAQSGGVNFADIMGDMQKDINRKVEDSIKKGVYVPPDKAPSPGSRAAELTADMMRNTGANGEVDGGFNLGNLGDPGFYRSPDGKDNYNDKCAEANTEVSTREREIANKMWNALPPEQRARIKQEQSDLDTYNSQTVYRIHPDPPATPTLDKFRESLSRSLAPLEKQRDANNHRAWEELPVEEKAEILRAIEQRKHFHAL